ncbi:FixH family protein [Domibacillus indicus]|uniref:FixH family protein n=1 Tax=Domibacillus indicus TaxID=1437523 RepID=UPI000697E783|nr:FixH family protein [Domibacillus indicus]
MKKQIIWLVAGLVFMLAACTSEKEQAANKPTEPIEALLNVPERAGLGEEITLSTKVTQNGEPVNDADEVKYEIWKDGSKENSEMVEASLKENGVYTASKIFEEEAAYHVQVHVTARNLHTMPKSVIAIGNAAVPAEEEETTEQDMESMDH